MIKNAELTSQYDDNRLDKENASKESKSEYSPGIVLYKIENRKLIGLKTNQIST